MATDPPKQDPRVIAAYLDDVDLDLDAARRLTAVGTADGVMIRLDWANVLADPAEPAQPGR
jgi:hypothetical protein